MSVTTVDSHLAIRDERDEILGIVMAGKSLSGMGISINHALIASITEEIGHNGWWFDPISQVEFETYKAFGFKEYEGVI